MKWFEDRVAASWLFQKITLFTLDRCFGIFSRSKEAPVGLQKLGALLSNRQDALHDWMHNNLETNNLVWIYCGANDGHFLEKLPRGSRVVCIEPNSIHNETLTRKGQSLGLDISVRNEVLGSEAGTQEFIFNEHSALSGVADLAINYELSEWSQPLAQGELYRETLTKTTLDLIVADFPDKKFGLIIDVQGSENAVIAGATAALKNTSILVIEVSTIRRYETHWDLGSMLKTLADSFRLMQVNPFLTSGSRYGSQGFNPLAPVLELDLFFVDPSVLES